MPHGFTFSDQAIHFQKYNSASLECTTFSTFVGLIFAVSAVVSSSPEAYPYMPT